MVLIFLYNYSQMFVAGLAYTYINLCRRKRGMTIPELALYFSKTIAQTSILRKQRFFDSPFPGIFLVSFG